MATSTTEICNLALSRIGARLLASYESDASVEANACRLHYQTVLDGLLRRHQWDFATRTAILVRLATPPIAEWALAWQLPVDCARVMRLESGGFAVLRFARHGRSILTHHHDELRLVYVSNLIPIDEWDSLFVEAIALKLAASICSNISKNPQVATDCLNQLEQLALPSAQTADARESLSGENMTVSDLIRRSSLARARRARGFIPRAEIP